MTHDVVRVVVVLALALVATWPQRVRADSAEQAFAKGEALLAKADFEGAARAFAQAARADRNKPEYLQHYTLVNRIVELRRQLAAERDVAQWEYLARGLHTFYISQGLYPEALALDEQIHRRVNSAQSATMLAETQLAMHKNAEAAGVLAALAPAKQTPTTQALQGLALVRQGQAAEASRLAAQIQLPADAGPGMIYSVARLQAATGNSDAALKLLQRCFESVAPSQLEGFKAHARQSPEFASQVSTAAFAKVLETQSKVAESKCSGGSRCSNCPMRGKCGGSQTP